MRARFVLRCPSQLVGGLLGVWFFRRERVGMGGLVFGRTYCERGSGPLRELLWRL
jgi:hypothetical protein